MEYFYLSYFLLGKMTDPVRNATTIFFYSKLNMQKRVCLQQQKMCIKLTIIFRNHLGSWQTNQNDQQKFVDLDEQIIWTRP
jgi:hypothetical protein